MSNIIFGCLEWILINVLFTFYMIVQAGAFYFLWTHIPTPIKLHMKLAIDEMAAESKNDKKHHKLQPVNTKSEDNNIKAEEYTQQDFFDYLKEVDLAEKEMQEQYNETFEMPWGSLLFANAESEDDLTEKETLETPIMYYKNTQHLEDTLKNRVHIVRQNLKTVEEAYDAKRHEVSADTNEKIEGQTRGDNEADTILQ